MNAEIKLPNFFKPEFETDLLRIGNYNDGGYLIPQKSLERTKILHSFGLSTDWSFEEEIFKKVKPKIYSYDHTVNFKSFVKLFINNPTSIFQYFKYKKFFDGKDKIHIKKRICPSGSIALNRNSSSFIDLNQIIRKKQNREVLLKVDIEGDEYRILDQIIYYSNSLNCLAIEFHNCDLNLDRIKNFINNFDLQLVHIHVNNWSIISPNKIPRAIELIFSPIEFNKKITKEKKYPTLLDNPNNKKYKDLKIVFF
tara:strand:- start:337 stop:1095 length:759 start_codon:yes stop_codon:yes gene_type:complete